MSQKRTDFQSKPRFGGQKFGGKGKGPGGGGKRPPRKDFGERSEGDRAGGGEGRSFSKPRYEGGGERKERSFGDKPRGDRPRGDRPFGKKPFGDRKERSFGDKPRFDRDDRPRGDKPFGKKPFGDRKEGGFRKERSFGDKPRFDRDDRSRGDKPFGKKPFGDRKEGGFRKERSFGDKPRFDRDDRPRGDRPFGKKPFGDRKEGGFRKEKSFEGRRPFDDRKEKSWQRYDERGSASPETREKLKSERAAFGAPSSAFLYGVHAVTEALQNPKRLHQRLLCTSKGFEAIEGALARATELGIKLPAVITVEKDDISRLLPRDAVHQDLLLDTQPLEEVFLVDILNTLPEDAKVIILDQVTDPHNVGAIIRSAAAFGVSAVIAQKLHAPDITGTLAKAASGAVEHVPFVREVNLSRALEQLKEAGFTCVGLAEEGRKTLAELKLSGKVALVLGAEGDGLRRLVAENCDTLARLPTQGAIASLNVSNAAAVALYELVR